MVLIFTVANDFSTNEIIDILISRKISYMRVNEDDLFDIARIDENGIVLTSRDRELDLSQVSSVWYRKSRLQLRKVDLSSKQLENYRNEEISVLNEYVLFLLGKKVNLGSYTNSKVNKLIVNAIASNLGFRIPSFRFQDSQTYKSDSNSITKSIHENSIAHAGEGSFYKLLTLEAPDRFVGPFSLSYFQEKIHKKYELRVFYLNGKTYAMAIFSQRNEKTDIDFRNYDRENPNRTVPYRLSDEIDAKVQLLMSTLGLNMGSIDILVDRQMNHYFLEVNPVGQFGMVSYPCNYNLEEKIANYLAYGK